MNFKSLRRITRNLVASAVVGGFMFSTTFVANADEKQGGKDNSIKTIYHVYLGDKSIGNVDNKHTVTTYVDKLIDKAKKEHPDYNYVLNQELSIVPEKTFDPSYNNEQTLKQLKKDVSVKISAVAIELNGKPILYVKNEKEAKRVLKQFELQFMSKNDLATYEWMLKHPNQIPTSEDKKSVDGIKKVSLSKDVKFSKTKVKEKGQVKTVKEAVDSLSNGNLVEGTYRVKKGDTISGIADKFNLKVDVLEDLNPGLKSNKYLGIDDSIKVKKPEPYLKLIVVMNDTDKVTIASNKKTIKTDQLYKGETKVVQEGENGTKRVKSRKTIVNGKVSRSKVLEETVLTKPKKEIVKVGTKVISSRGTGNLKWPANGGITSGFGKRWGKLHKGIDISKSGGRTIVAADNGVIESAGWDDGGYGNRIVINHNNGMKTTYNHLSKINVHAGQVVQKGEKIAVMGSTGDSTGPHLHFEIYKNGNLVNPIDFLP